ncbi:uncharacterized protein LOC108742836 [Agrilus planipennis]|uniref:Uncharacterized protein LOC108742836 n=1 Tax=Agrilus planipennis TaxID=224129 RepID=A0A7F5RH29_AGRPL|nr:uncharacterized protein LOC108742836 [Agrilus planipennis]
MSTREVIIGDKSGVYGYDVETKVQSSQRKLPHEPSSKKARAVMHREFLSQGKTVNKEYYLQIMRNLRKAIHRKARICGKTKIGFFLHHDDASAHTLLFVREFLVKNNTLIIPQPLYSPDQAPYDFFFFPKLKRLRYDCRDKDDTQEGAEQDHKK